MTRTLREKNKSNNTLGKIFMVKPEVMIVADKLGFHREADNLYKSRTSRLQAEAESPGYTVVEVS